MGCGQSALKKEIATLHALDAERAAEMVKLEDERRMLKYKMAILEEMVATAQLEAQEKAAQATRAEERMNVMKWEMIRQARPTTPRQSLKWELNEKTVQKLTKSATTKDIKTDKTKNEPVVEKPQEKETIPVLASSPVPNLPQISEISNQANNNDDPASKITEHKAQDEQPRTSTPRLPDNTTEIVEVETFHAPVASNSRRTKDINSIERGDASSLRRHSSKGFTNTNRRSSKHDAESIDGMNSRILTHPSSHQTLVSKQTPIDSKPELSKRSPTSSARSSIVVNSRESSPKGKDEANFVFTMPLSKSQDLPPRKSSNENSPPRHEAKRMSTAKHIEHEDEPDSEDEPSEVKAFCDDDVISLDGNDDVSHRK